MGCTISKRARNDRRRSPGSPLARSHSLPLDSKPSAVGLASSTLGSLMLDQEFAVAAEEAKKSAEKVAAEAKTDLSTTIAKAKLWSEKMGKRIPKMPRERPANEPESIDASALMAGLEEAAASRFSVTAVVDRHSLSFFPIHDSQTVLESVQSTTTIWSAGVTFQSPLWKPAAEKIDEKGVGAVDFDPEVLSAFRKAMEELSPQHPCLLRSPDSRTLLFQERIDTKKPNPQPCKAAEQGKVVLYFTSLRGVRKTYEDCFLVRMILKSYSVRVDERDVSMDRGYREELRGMMTEAGVKQSKESSLPAVFANAGYLGGVEEVRRMHEDGELLKELAGCQMVAAVEGGRPCEGCGGIRFVVCERCSGSCKVAAPAAAAVEDVGGGFRRCAACNENGLVRCPVCCR